VPDSHETDDKGRPLWTVDVIVDDPDADRAEIAGVEIASVEVPEVKLGEEVRFIGLTCLPYVGQGTNRVALSWSAEGIERPAGQQGKQAA
jgi:hypothetical protein